MEQSGDNVEARLEDLEVRMAFLEKGIADLDQVIQEFNDQLRTRDVISILKQLHTAGHLRAKFEVED